MPLRRFRQAQLPAGRRHTALTLESLEGRAVPAVVAAPASMSLTEGQSRQVTFRLAKPPTANVTFTLASANAAEVTIDRQSLTFTPVNWKTPQAVTVTAVEDFVQDGNKSLRVVTSAVVSTDKVYANRMVPDVTAKTIDSKKLPPLNPAVYQGSYSGSFTGKLASGPITATVAGRTITFDILINAPSAGINNEPTTESATIGDDGALFFQDQDGEYDIVFMGKLQVGVGGAVSAAGTWKYGTVASGTWRIDRVALPSTGLAPGR